MVGTQMSRRYQTWRTRSRRARIQVEEESRNVAVSWWNDLMTARLVPIKITFFLIMGATQCIAPYGSVFMKSLGITLEEASIIFGIASIIPLMAPLLAGCLTDKMGNFRIFLVTIVALSGIFALFNLAIPPARITASHKKEVIPYQLTCSRNYFQMTIEEISSCKLKIKTISVETLNVTNCGYRCDPAIIDITTSTSLAKLQNIVFQNYHNNSFYYTCRIDNRQQKCLVNSVKGGNNINLSSLKKFQMSGVTIKMGTAQWNGRMANVELPHSYKMTPSESEKFECPKGYLTRDIHLRKLSIGDIHVPFHRSKNGFGWCQFHCTGNLTHKDMCNKTEEVKKQDVFLTLWLFGGLKVMSSFLIGLTYTMFEAGAIAILKEYNDDYGWQRMYGSIGGMIFAPFAGFLIDYYGSGGKYSDYYLAFIMYFIVKIICALFLTRLDLEFRNPARSIFGNFLVIFSSIEAVLLILVVFVSGLCYGFIEHFLPWYIHSLGAKNWLIGTMTTVASLSAVPFLACSGYICDTFGHVQAISFGLVCYSIRCLGYSLVKDPYWFLPFEVLEGVSTGLLVAAAVIYGAKLSSKSNVGTMQGILASSHYGLGKSLGSLCGGYMMSRLSAPIAFQIFSAISFSIGFLYYIIFKLVLLPRQEKIRIRNREVLEMPVTYLGHGKGLKSSDSEKSML